MFQDLNLESGKDWFDFQYLFMVCDCFGCDPEVIPSPHITRPRSTSTESCSILLRRMGKVLFSFEEENELRWMAATCQWTIYAEFSNNTQLQQLLLTFLSEKPRRGAPHWSHQAAEISPHVIPLVRFSLIKSANSCNAFVFASVFNPN